MNEAAPHILVVDDDTRLRDLLLRYLRKNSYMVSEAADAAQAGAAMRGLKFDLIVLDRMMPGEDGLSFARRLRKEGEMTPLLLLTALGEAEQRIEGLEAGVDDYLAKPFEPRELVLRIENILRRAREKKKKEILLVFGPYRFDAGQGALTRNLEPVYLTGSELALLKALAEKPGAPVAREMLAKAVANGGEKVNERSVDVLVTRLRKKLEEEPSKPVYLQTVRHAGYMLKAG